MTLVSIIIITFNPGIRIIECLNSIKSSNYQQFEVILIDNASIDNSIDVVKDSFKFVHIIRLNQNIGYGAAANLGIIQSKGELIIVMNQDIVVHEDWLSHLVGSYKKYGLTVYQPKILLAANPNIINTAGNMISLAGFTILRGSGMSSKLFNKTYEITYASGACFMMPKSIINTIGLFDPTYFMYKEDLDLGWRSLLAGYNAIYVPTAIVYHDYHPLKNIELKIYYSERNRLLTIFKNYSMRTLIILIPYLILNELLISGYFIIKGFMTLKIRTYIDCYRLLPHVLKERRKTQALRRVSDFYLVSNFFSYSADHLILSHLGKVANQFIESIGKICVSLMKTQARVCVG